MKGWTTRDLVTLAVFGALWGVAEMSLGAVLHAMRVPLKGLILSGIGLLVALTGYRFVPRGGAVSAIATVSALLKLFSISSDVISPMLAILAEGLLAELGLALSGRRVGRLPFALAGALGASWSSVHPFVSQGLLAGEQVFEIHRRAFASVVRLFHLDPQAVGLVLLIGIGLHALAGVVAGLLAYALGGHVAHRLATRGD